MSKAKWTKPGWQKPADLRRNAAAAGLRAHGHKVVPCKRRAKLEAARRAEAWA